MTQSPLIAIVDDEKHIRESLAQYFFTFGKYRTATFSEGNEVIAWMKKNTCDVCIIDIKMPGINGIETIEAIKAEKPAQKFIIFTGSRFQDLSQISEQLKIAEEYIIVKPLHTMEIFLDKIKKILQE